MFFLTFSTFLFFPVYSQECAKIDGGGYQTWGPKSYCFTDELSVKPRDTGRSSDWDWTYDNQLKNLRLIESAFCNSTCISVHIPCANEFACDGERDRLHFQTSPGKYCSCDHKIEFYRESFYQLRVLENPNVDQRIVDAKEKAKEILQKAYIQAEKIMLSGEEMEINEG